VHIENSKPPYVPEVDNNVLNFDLISDRRCLALTGLTVEQLHDLPSKFSNFKPPVKHPIKTCIGFYLMKLRMGLSGEELGALYGAISIYQIREMIKFVRDLLFEELTPLYLGTKQGITRAEIIENHTTKMAQVLLAAHCSAVISIWDATYIYIEKSANYYFQRSTFSMHKHTNLLKFMVMCATDGHIIDVVGPFICNGKNNDASMTEDILANKINQLEHFFEKMDVFVVDRGFRDCIEYIESKGFTAKMPSFLGKKKQHSSIESNGSRVVTKIRWVIESVFGRIKKWKYFANILINKNIPFIERDFKNICAIINKYRPQIADTNDFDQELVFNKMLILSKKENHFAKKAINFKNLITKKNKQFDPLTIEFPKLTEEYLQHLTMGVYQLKQALSYTKEHLQEDGKYIFELFEQDKNILHVKLKSRFQAKQFTIYGSLTIRFFV